MSYETFYDTGYKPFIHDKNRGKWTHPTDFLFACIGHAFKIDVILFLPVILFRQLGLYAIILYFLILAVCVVPIIFIQSFLGQFSSTGFISVFRIAPLFKGVGYMSLALNLITLAFYSVFTAIPLIFLFLIMRPVIPWSCEGASEWMIRKNNSISVCDQENGTAYDDFHYRIQIPSVDFVTTQMNFTKSTDEPNSSWLIFVCTFFLWMIVAFIVVRPIKTIGRITRYSCCAVIGIMCLLLIRFMLLPGALKGIPQFVEPFSYRTINAWLTFSFMVLTSLGPGWGSVITMASFNDFKTNIYSYSWIVSLVQMGVVLGMTFLPMLMCGYLFTPFGGEVRDYINNNSFLEFFVIPTGLTLLEAPHFWSLIFFVMLFLESLTLVVVQLTSVLTTLFDEYEELRSKKRTVSLATVGVLAISSLFFCEVHGRGLLALLTKSSIATQMILNMLLLVVVLWVYGRERFQKDATFMTTRVYSKLTVNVVRFVAPLFLILAILEGVSLTANHLFRFFSLTIILSMAALIVIPWCLIPLYCIYKLMHTSGRSSLQMKRSVRPTDWYPADPLYKQRYEETISNMETSHQLMNPREEGVNEGLNNTVTA